MSTAKHTPGIWRVAGYVDEDERDGAVAVVAHDGFIVAEVLKWPQQDANARLIAAAPDLLAVAKECIDLAKLAESLCGCRGDDDYVWGIQERLEAAIAKAEGRHD